MRSASHEWIRDLPRAELSVSPGGNRRGGRSRLNLMPCLRLQNYGRIRWNFSKGRRPVGCRNWYPIRYGRMLVSPFTFYRGAALIMAADLAEHSQLRSAGSAVRRCPHE